jgi:hypothetical protein
MVARIVKKESEATRQRAARIQAESNAAVERARELVDVARNRAQGRLNREALRKLKEK